MQKKEQILMVKKLLIVALSIVLCCVSVFAVGCGGNIETYTITFNADGGVVSQTSKEVELGKTIGELPVPTKEGYDFVKWVYINDNGNEFEINKDKIYNYRTDIEVLAIYNAKQYTVTFDPDGGTVSQTTLPVTYNEKIGVMPSPTNEDSTKYFAGWYVQGDSSQTIFTQESVYNFATDQTFVAKWVTFPTHEITYNLDGGAFASDAVVTSFYNNHEVVTIAVPNPTRVGHDFMGWIGTDLDTPTKDLSFRSVDEKNKVFTATWAQKTYDVTLVLDGTLDDKPVTGTLTQGMSTEINDIAYGTKISTILPTIEDMTVSNELVNVCEWCYVKGSQEIKINLDSDVFSETLFGEETNLTFRVKYDVEYTITVTMNVGEVTYSGGNYVIKARLGEKLGECGLLTWKQIEDRGYLKPINRSLEHYVLATDTSVKITPETIVTFDLFDSFEVELIAVYKIGWSGWG